MHVLQHIAVISESKEEAAKKVSSIFNDMYTESEGLGGWSDWFVVGGGRWNSDSGNQYQDSFNDVVSYADEHDNFNKTIENAMESRRQEMEGLSKYVELDKFNNHIQKFISGDYLDEDRFDMTSYYVRSVASILSGYWDSNSYFYDLENHTTSAKYMREDIDKGNQNWYAVPVDFHF
jgi:hypothetical protein